MLGVVDGGSSFWILLRIFCVCLDVGWIVEIFGADLASQMVPQGCARTVLIGPLGSKTVLKSPWFGSLVVLWFEIASFGLLGSFWGRFGVLLGSSFAFWELLLWIVSVFGMLACQPTIEDR